MNFPEPLFLEMPFPEKPFGVTMVGPNGIPESVGSEDRIWRYYTASECDFPKCTKWEIDLEQL